MDETISLIRSILEDTQDPLEVTSPLKVQAELGLAEKLQEDRPSAPLPPIDLQPLFGQNNAAPPNVKGTSRSTEPLRAPKPTGRDIEPSADALLNHPRSSGPKPPDWLNRPREVRVVDTLRFAAQSVSETPQHNAPGKHAEPISGARVSGRQINNNFRITTISPEVFPLDTDSVFAAMDKKFELPPTPGGDVSPPTQLQLPPFDSIASTESVVAQHYAETQGVLDLDVRNTLE